MSPVQHFTAGEAEETHLQALKEATDSDHWMTAVWCVRGGKLVLISRTTWDFPSGDFDKAVRLLEFSCKDEASGEGDVLPDDPLPMADFNVMKRDSDGDGREDG